MLGRFDHTCHLSILKWRQGESSALSTARVVRERLIPLFEMPPAGDFDYEKQRPLSPTEHIRLFGVRLRERWGQRPAFVDAVMIDDALHKQDLARHPLTELLERARLARALALPVTSLGRSEEYQSATRRFVENSSGLPICLRATSADLDSDTFVGKIGELLDRLSCRPSQTFFVMDFKGQNALSEREVEDFVALLLDRISELPFLHEWLGLAIALSSFPDTVKVKVGEVKIYPRTDLLIYDKLLVNPKSLLRTPMFGDYALDTSSLREPQRATPSAHIRYSTLTNYIISKDNTVKKPYGYEAIYPAAERLVSRSEFMGRDYSEGDLFIDQLAQRVVRTGNAPKWRWAGTDHHLTLNLRTIKSLFGIVEPETAELARSAASQGSLFAELASPPTAPESPSDEIAEHADGKDENK
jgi:hypothetical protein